MGSVVDTALPCLGREVVVDEAGENILDHFEYPRNYGALPNATWSQRADNPLCGDRITLFLIISDQVITQAHFEGRGCTISQAAASMLTEHLIGQSLDAAQGLDVEAVISWLAVPLNPARRKCASLGLQALHAGLAAHRQSTTAEPNY